METTRKPSPNQYVDRNGNIRTRALRHSVRHARTFAELEARAIANVVPAPTLEQRRADAIRELIEA